jgi:hypothetical protein
LEYHIAATPCIGKELHSEGEHVNKWEAAGMSMGEVVCCPAGEGGRAKKTRVRATLAPLLLQCPGEDRRSMEGLG